MRRRWLTEEGKDGKGCVTTCSPQPLPLSHKPRTLAAKDFQTLTLHLPLPPPIAVQRRGAPRKAVAGCAPLRRRRRRHRRWRRKARWVRGESAQPSPPPRPLVICSAGSRAYGIWLAGSETTPGRAGEGVLTTKSSNCESLRKNSIFLPQFNKSNVLKTLVSPSPSHNSMP